MPLDINAFRSIANQTPDKLVYVHGQSLKTTRNQERHGAHTYQAATNAFLKACTDHYGSRMGDAIVKFLQADIEGGKPLTARKIKALVEFADETMGSATKIDVGGKAVELEKVGTGIRRQLMKEAKLLSELTSPHVLIKAERDQLADELVDLPAGQEFDVKNARLQEIDQQILQSEKQQTDTLSNQQIVDLVEDAIRSRPQDFPLLTKYYLNAE